jgi:murein DD-endopeptidase MepM/ murein hydrolase activator NlpD
LSVRRIAALLVALLCPAAASAVDLEGTWYVLVHFQDEATNKPDQWRWDDRVWTFTRKGDRLEWTEYPIVQFDDDTGRFEAQRGGRAARVLGAWEPNASQLADIQDGLAVNSRGSKTKTLRTTDAGARGGAGEGGGAESAMVITYSESWSITGLPDLPAFTRDDSMGGASAEEMSGSTQYRTESSDGGELRGTFERDGTRKGRFRMLRTSSHGLTSASKDQEELQRKAGVRALTSSTEMRELVREQIEQGFAESGVTLTDEQLDAIVLDAVQAMARGESPETIAPRLEKTAEKAYFAFAKPDAVHDDTVRYRWPFDASAPRQLGQGVGGDIGVGVMGEVVTNRFSHKGRFEEAFDFVMPVGTPVLAAREGEVVRAVGHFTEGGARKGLAGRANVVTVLHADGTFANYVHLSPQLDVKVGQRVAAGDVLGKSGNTGYTTGPHLHFDVQRLDASGEPETVSIRFDDGSAAGVVPVTGAYYGGSARSKSTP